MLQQELPPEMDEVLRPYVAAGLRALASAQPEPACFLDSGEPLAELTRQYMDMLLKGNRQAASRLILDAVEAGANIRDIYLHVFQQSQYEIGRLWQTNQISVAQEHLFTAGTQLIMSQLYSHVFASKKNGRTLVAACVGGDLHEIGCRMVADFFEMEGWDTFYFGANTPTPSIIEAVQEHRAELLAVSATMTFSCARRRRSDRCCSRRRSGSESHYPGGRLPVQDRSKFMASGGSGCFCPRCPGSRRDDQKDVRMMNDFEKPSV